MPEAANWATELVFRPEKALDAWRGLLRGIESVGFREVPSDVVGRIFQKLIGPEERHRYGQHFTGDDVVNLINAFCIRAPGDTVLDPACGSGSFLVRAYSRKRHLDLARTHLDVLRVLFGCDVALYPAHLATLNLAAREINDEANYPRVARRIFLDFNPADPFCTIPDGNDGQIPVALPTLDAIVGNPPYIRHEKIVSADKVRTGALATAAWPDMHLNRRSDLHCDFWPAAARLISPARQTRIPPEATRFPRRVVFFFVAVSGGEKNRAGGVRPTRRPIRWTSSAAGELFSKAPSVALLGRRPPRQLLRRLLSVSWSATTVQPSPPGSSHSSLAKTLNSSPRRATSQFFRLSLGAAIVSIRTQKPGLAAGAY
jgi:methylase of polypeptide subunit release factors